MKTLLIITLLIFTSGCASWGKKKLIIVKDCDPTESGAYEVCEPVE